MNDNAGSSDYGRRDAKKDYVQVVQTVRQRLAESSKSLTMDELIHAGYLLRNFTREEVDPSDMTDLRGVVFELKGWFANELAGFGERIVGALSATDATWDSRNIAGIDIDADLPFKLQEYAVPMRQMEDVRNKNTQLEHRINDYHRDLAAYYKANDELGRKIGDLRKIINEQATMIKEQGAHASKVENELRQELDKERQAHAATMLEVADRQAVPKLYTSPFADKKPETPSWLAPKDNGFKPPWETATNTPRMDNPTDPRWSDIAHTRSATTGDLTHVIRELQKMIKQFNEVKAEHGDRAYKKGVAEGATEARTEVESTVRKYLEEYKQAQMLPKLLDILKAGRVMIRHNYKGEHSRTMDFTPTLIQMVGDTPVIVGMNNTSEKRYTFASDEIDGYDPIS